MRDDKQRNRDRPYQMRLDFLKKPAARISYDIIRAWMGTLDYRIAMYDESLDPALTCNGNPQIYLMWHEYMLCPLYLRRNCNVSALFSKHGDADILAEVAQTFGYGAIRGSTFRGGANALRKLGEAAANGSLGITPDGPRGPRRKVAQGAIYLASELEMPITIIAIGYDRPWRVKSWDRFAVPRPFSRARIVVSPKIHIPKNLNRAAIETHRVDVQQLMRDLTEEAEAWAEAGTRKHEERVDAPLFGGVNPNRRKKNAQTLTLLQESTSFAA